MHWFSPGKLASWAIIVLLRQHDQHLSHVVSNEVCGWATLGALVAWLNRQLASRLIFQERIVAPIGMRLQGHWLYQ